ncbi:HMCN1 [Branchiostoma lanceolatum]|uniref:HMCN1 protein n=1 Tax=Branchiostoma lanceolatum TaxID=7740 RepID=A0A8J9VJM1_BRALA|nr:HMCN1 [Branchiostoma lanceolatum]
MKTSSTLVLVLWILATNTETVNSQSQIGLALPDDVNTVVGDPSVLPADYSTELPVISITWSKLASDNEKRRNTIMSYDPNTGTVNAFGDYKNRVSLTDKASLRIDSTDLSDAGTYVLSLLIEDIGTEEGFITLNVMVPPTIEVGPSNPYVAEWGETVTLTCLVTNAIPAVTFLRWEKDGIPVDGIAEQSKYSGGNLDSPSLLIRHVMRADAGRYTCIANHPVRPAAANIRLDVLFPASIISFTDSTSATEADPITLQCVADGNPPPNITWVKDGGRLKSAARSQPVSKDVRASSLVLSRVKLNDTGEYKCTASNGIGKSDARTMRLSIRAARKKLSSAIVAVIVGATAGGLWLVICVLLVVWFIKRRRSQKEKKKFAFYYNIGRRDQGRMEGKMEMEEDREPPPYASLPEKPTNQKSGYAGIETMRKSASQKFKERRYAKALYAYGPREENELSLEPDDVIEVLEGEDGGWCLGYLSGRIGLFPSNYVQFIPARQVMAAKAGVLCKDIEDDTPSKRSI